MSSLYWRRLGSAAVLVVLAAACRSLCAAEAVGPAADANQLAGLWNDLASPDGAKIAPAILKLVAHGDAAAAFLAGKLKTQRAPVDTKRIAELIRELDAADWRTREKAHKELASIGPEVVPFLREQLGKEPTAEVKARAEAILAELEASGAADPAARRRSWALEVLGRIGSPRAAETLLALRAATAGDDRPWVDVTLLNVAERALPGLLDAAGAEARKGNYAAAAKLCGKALDTARGAEHYGQGRIEAILRYLRAVEKGQKVPADVMAKLKAPAAGQNAKSIDARIGWAMVRGPNVLSNADFAVRQVQGIWPTAPGIWGGDMATIVAAEQGIKPYEGAQMLRFHHTNFRSGGDGTGCQVCQVVDVTKFRDAVGAGKVSAWASVRFNRVAGNARTDTCLGVGLIAYSGSPANHFAMSQRGGHVAVAPNAIHTDGDPASWEKLAVRMRLPKNTDFLSIQLLAVEDVHNDLQGVEFDGHYADGAFVTLVTDDGEHLVPPAAPPPPIRLPAGPPGPRRLLRNGVEPDRNRASSPTRW
jgi:hypothetical protein